MHGSHLYSPPARTAAWPLFNMRRLQPPRRQRGAEFILGVFIGAPGGRCNCSVMMRTAAAQRTVSLHRHTGGGAEGRRGGRLERLLRWRYCGWKSAVSTAMKQFLTADRRLRMIEVNV